MSFYLYGQIVVVIVVAMLRYFECMGKKMSVCERVRANAHAKIINTQATKKKELNNNNNVANCK